MSIRSSENDRRRAGASAEPSRAPAPVRSRTAPSFHVSPSRRSNSSRKVRKPDDPAHQAHRRRGQPHADAPQLGGLGGGGGRVGDLGARDAQGGEGGGGEGDHGQHHHALGAADREGDARPGAATSGTDEPGQELELRVGLHQLGVVAHDGGHDGAPRHRVRLAHGQHGEGLREQQQPVEVVDHDQAHQGPAAR